MNKHHIIEELLNSYHDMLTAQHIGVRECDFSELINKFRELISLISEDYETYRKYISKLLSLLEKNDSTSIAIVGESFFDLLDTLIDTKEFTQLDTSFLNNSYDSNISDELFNAYDKTFPENNQVRISNFILKKDELTNESKLGIISSISDFITAKAKTLEWDEETIEIILIQLASLHDLLKDQNEIFLFYYLLGAVFDRFTSSEFYQQSRDLAEEIILTSYNDNICHLGYLNSFICYSNNSSPIAALLYANFCLHNALITKADLQSKFIKELIWQGMKFFRNISLQNHVERIYKSISKTLDWDKYEKRSLEHTYLLSLLKTKDPQLPSKFLDFLQKNREDIIQSGINDCLPLLISLYNIQRLYPNADFSSTGFGYYISLFEMIVPKERVEKYKTIITGDLKQNIVFLKSSLIKLNETRNRADFVNDNEIAISIANRIITNSIKEENIEALLLIMLLKADFSILFLEKRGLDLAPIHIPKLDSENFEKIYGNNSKYIDILKRQNNVSFIWLMVSEEQLFQLNLFEEQFKTFINKYWEFEKFKDLTSNSFFSQLYFNDTIKTKNDVRMVLPEEHEQESQQFIESFDFAKLEINESNKPLLIILDIDIAGFPHNLFLDINGNCIYLNRSICNILSTEWFLKFSNQQKLSKDFTKSIWIPTEGGDFSINQLFSNLEECLTENSFSIESSVNPSAPIDSELNIITSHGSSDIALKQVFYPDGIPRLNLNSYLGKGKILIFFVCHSGSTKSTPFKNSMSTVIKEYISNGYVSVVAPFWSLHISIPPIWLDKFMKSMNSGNDINTAVHQANLAVFERFPTLSAWACMHLYGDPFIKIQ